MNSNSNTFHFFLRRLPGPLKSMLFSFVMLQTIAVGLGIVYIYHNTHMSGEGISRQYGGQQESSDDDFEIEETYAKPLAEMLITTHNHLFGFAFIFLFTGTLFYFSAFPLPRLKVFLLTEPFITVLFTFGGLWLVRFFSTAFSILVIFFSTLTYVSYFIMAFYIARELLRHPENK